MDIQPIIERLRKEREAISIAIMALERVAAGGHGKRGRPPKEWSALSTELQRQLDAAPGLAKQKPAKPKVMAAGHGAIGF